MCQVRLLPLPLLHLLVSGAPAPLSSPLSRVRLALVADPDKASRRGEEWVTVLREGELVMQGDGVEITWEEEQEISNNLAAGGRAMELSELIMFEDKLVTVDDKTGVVYRLANTSGLTPVPWVILSSGPGNRTRGFKGEWGTVVGERLVVGSHGSEFRSRSGDRVLHRDRMWVKVISRAGIVTHHNWTENFLAVRTAAGISWPGFIIHEAVCWSRLRREWTFLPRRISEEGYDPRTVERLGANIMVTADETFTTFRTLTLGERIPGRGFSSFKFLPGSQERIMVGLRTEEVGEKVESFITVFNTEGKILLGDTKIGDRKYEGVEIIGRTQPSEQAGNNEAEDVAESDLSY